MKPLASNSYYAKSGWRLILADRENKSVLKAFVRYPLVMYLLTGTMPKYSRLDDSSGRIYLSEESALKAIPRKQA